MDIWMLHALMFIFGYVTCKTFYFLNTTRLSLKLLKSSRVIYLLMAVKAVENYMTSERIMIQHMKQTEQDDETKKRFRQKFAQELERFQAATINGLLSQTPEAFKPGLEFDDWASAMLHLQAHKEEALTFWRMSNDR